MRLHVDAWNPEYGSGFEAPEERSDALSDVEVERPERTWKPLAPPPEVRQPPVVLFVDGVRRLDAHVWTVEDSGDTHAGLCASYAAGVVRCDGTARIVAQLVRRGLFTASDAAPDIAVPGRAAVSFPAHRVPAADLDTLRVAVQEQLRRTEIAVAESARDAAAAQAGGELPADDLLVVDGPLRGRGHLARTLGYIKSQERRYLPAELEPVIGALRPGQRTPVFALGSSWRRYTWYLRLPGAQGPLWAGIVRVECSADVPVREAVAFADISARTLPRYASKEFRDPRAPQNLVPIAGLERALRTRLGDVRLLRRGLRAAAAATHG